MPHPPPCTTPCPVRLRPMHGCPVRLALHAPFRSHTPPFATGGTPWTTCRAGATATTFVADAIATATVCRATGAGASSFSYLGGLPSGPLAPISCVTE